MRKHLDQGNIVIHPFITAELALGSLKERTKTLALLDLLPQLRVAQLSEVRLTIEARRLYSLDIGLADAHLIASVLSILPRFCGQKISDSVRPPKLSAFTPACPKKQERTGDSVWR